MKRLFIRASVIACVAGFLAAGLLVVHRGRSTAVASEPSAAEPASSVAFRSAPRSNDRYATPASSDAGSVSPSRPSGIDLAFVEEPSVEPVSRYPGQLTSGVAAISHQGDAATPATGGSSRYPALATPPREPNRFPPMTTESAAGDTTSNIGFSASSTAGETPTAGVPTLAPAAPAAESGFGGAARYPAMAAAPAAAEVFGTAPANASTGTPTPAPVRTTDAFGNRYTPPTATAATPASATAPASEPWPTSAPMAQAHATVAPSSGGVMPPRSRGMTSDSASALPGAQALEGAQSPAIVIEKIAPDEIQVGKQATFEIHVRNVGATPAENVELHDIVPRGTQLVSTHPQAAEGAAGSLTWSVGTLKPGDEFAAQLELMPVEEGEIGSVATVHFSAEASVRTLCTRPKLAVEVAAEPTVMIGDTVVLNIRVSNPGTGVATGVVLEEHVPDSLEHPAGPELVYEVGDLGPGETRELELTMTATRAGKVLNVITARGDGQLSAQSSSGLEIQSPALVLGLDGPRRRYLDRQATYSVSVSNPGTAAAREIELVTYLPTGLKFVEANNAGEYDPRSRSVHWLLEELPPNEMGTVTLVTVPVEPGEYTLRVESSADLGVSAKAEEAITVEGVAHVVYQVVDLADPIEVGGETSYEVRVTNQGTKAAGNVQITASLSSELQATTAEGPTRHQLSANQVQFAPIASLGPGEEVVFVISARGAQPGDPRIRVQLTTDELRTPVTKEENTRVYSDE